MFHSFDVSKNIQVVINDIDFFLGFLINLKKLFNSKFPTKTL